MGERPQDDNELLERSLRVTPQDLETLRRAGHSPAELIQLLLAAALRAARLRRDSLAREPERRGDGL